MEKYSLLEIVTKLVGDVHPVGAAHIDPQRFENLQTLCDLTESLVCIINKVHYENEGRQEASVRQAADYAENFIKNVLGIQ